MRQQIIGLVILSAMVLGVILIFSSLSGPAQADNFEHLNSVGICAYTNMVYTFKIPEGTIYAMAGGANATLIFVPKVINNGKK